MKLLKTCLLLSATSAVLFFSGCATFVRGGSEKVTFQSDPSGAEVRLSTGQTGVTPCQLDLKRKGDIQVTIRKDGFKELTTALISSIDGKSVGIGTAANFLFLPIINDVVDYKTGANYSHKPNPLVVKLIPLGAAENYQLVAPSAAPAAKTERAAEPNKESATKAAEPPAADKK